jgi:DNA topoisomerase VI subunit A
MMTSTDAYGPWPIKRDRRSKDDIAAVKAAIVTVLEADHPMTVRQVFYQLVVRGAIEKTEAEYKRTVVRLLTDMRMDSEVPFDWIEDNSRRRMGLRSYSGVAEALEDTARFYRRNAMRESDVYIEIWCEKEALSGILWHEAADYGVPVIVSKGMPSLTQLYETAKLVRMAAGRLKETFIYQFGDHDPSGVLIPQTIKSRLGELCQKLCCPPPQIERVALTERHIEQFNLPTRPTKRDGNTHALQFEGDSVELDALPAAELRRMVGECIERHISPAQFAALMAAEESERTILLRLAGGRHDRT